jgi:hypothetical protein
VNTISTIINSVANGVNWTAVFYIFFATIVLVILEKSGISLLKFFTTIVGEIRDLSGLDFTAGAINILGIIAMLCLCGVALIAPGLREVLAAISAARSSGSGETVTPGTVFTAMILIGAFAVISALVVQAGSRPRR